MELNGNIHYTVQAHIQADPQTIKSDDPNTRI